MKLPRGKRARQLFDELARQLRVRRAPRKADQRPGNISGRICDEPKERVRAAEPDAGTLVHLFSLGTVATAVVVVFFGLGFFLLAHPNDEVIAGAGLGKRSAELAASTSSVAPAPQTREPSSPAASGGVAGDPPSDASAGTEAANASLTVPSPEQPALGPNAEAGTLAASAGVPHAKTARIARYRHNGARKHWASIYRPATYPRPPPAVGGPEKAWRWFVRSAASVLAALSPPPSRQAAGFRTR